MRIFEIILIPIKDIDVLFTRYFSIEGYSVLLFDDLSNSRHYVFFYLCYLDRPLFGVLIIAKSKTSPQRRRNHFVR